MDFSNDSDGKDTDFEGDGAHEDSDFEVKLLKTKFKVRVKKNENLKKISIPREGVKNIEIDFYRFDEQLAAFITSFPNLKSILLLAVDDDFFNDQLTEMAAKLPVLSKMDIRIWQKLDRFDYNEYNIAECSLDTVHQLMDRCKKLKQIKILSKYDFRFHDLDDYDSVGIDEAKLSLENFGKKLRIEKPRWKFEFVIPLIDHCGTGYSYSVKK